LQQRLAACQHDKTIDLVNAWPLRCYFVGQRIGIRKLSAQRAVCTYKVGIAKIADCACTVLLAARLQVTACKTAKYRRPARVGTFALQGVKNFFNLVTHQAHPRELDLAVRFLVMVIPLHEPGKSIYLGRRASTQGLQF